ncbi:putative integral membrane protein [Mycobacterium basiliense]|uniref:Putative integral membrane protein n=1 Tax=Mycobacterium basiliense TaxID=2094119 RepID=A0A447GFG2_9MYCO|nr:hypothetical protein [Mycobacterium basiliense]VDM89164.1 putative integral membrane protein [Mycobacterium basiliense]
MSHPPQYSDTPVNPHGGSQYPPGRGAPPSRDHSRLTAEFKLREAFGWAWKTFIKNAVALLIPNLVYLVLIGAAGTVLVLGQGLGTKTTGSANAFDFTANLSGQQTAIMLIGNLLFLSVFAFAQSAFLSGCLDLADGRAVSIGSFFKPRNFGMVFLAALLIGVLNMIGWAMFVIPGVFIGIFTQFTISFVIDRSQSAIKGLASSFSTVAANFVSALLVWLAIPTLLVVGLFACGVGLLVADSVASLVLIYAYRKLSGGQVVRPDQPGYSTGSNGT